MVNGNEVSRMIATMRRMGNTTDAIIAHANVQRSGAEQFGDADGVAFWGAVLALVGRV